MNIQKTTCKQLTALVEELPPTQGLVVLTDPKSGPSKEAMNLCEAALPALSSQKQYLNIQGGLTPKKAPFYVLDWAKASGHPQERRWLANQLVASVAAGSKIKSWNLFVDKGGSQELLAMAEDFYFAKTNPISGEPEWEVQIIQSQDDCDDIDPYRATRTKYLDSYRKWINENPDELTSIELGKRLGEFAGKHGCKFETLDTKALEKKKLNLLLAVGQASERSPSQLHLVSKNLDKGDPLLLVGKGITFDTGGINVKVHENFVNAMKNDMGGAALMSNLFMALISSGYEGPIALAIPCCENLVAEKSMKPGTVLTAYNGKTVMIEHTDAEGRLILADALSYANEAFSPKETWVAATLTTAALRQFSGFFTPVHFAGEDLQRKIASAGARWGEQFTYWDYFLPFLKANHSAFADLTNMGRMPHHSSIGGGSNVAAHFLKEFCPSPMVHFDIFASCWNWGGDYPGSAVGATGAPFNSLFEVLRA